MAIPIAVYWTKYTTTMNGRVLKLVPCENCSTEYVYVLERESTGIGTSVYFLNDVGAENHSVSAADETLQEYLTNDFDPVPCPVCGHYQRYMFPKLYETKSLWGTLFKFLLLALGCMDFMGAVHWTLKHLKQPSERSWRWLTVTWLLLALLSLVGLVLAALERAKFRRFDPNLADEQTRIQIGRSRAVTRAEFEAAQQRAAAQRDQPGM